MNGTPDVIIIFDKMQTELFFNKSKIPKSDYKNLYTDNVWHNLYVKCK